MHRGLTIPLLLCTAACTAPDLTPEIQSFAVAVEEVRQPLHATLTHRYNAARNRQFYATIRKVEDVYTLSEACSAAGTDTVADDIKSARSCEAIDSFPISDEMELIELALMVEAVLGDYLDALVMLSDSDLPVSIGKHVPVLGSELERLGKATGDENIAAATARLARYSGALGKAAGMASEAARAGALRKAIREGDGAVTDAVDSLIAMLERLGESNLSSRFAAVRDAEAEMTAAKRQGSAAYTRAIGRFEAAVTALRSEATTTLSGRLAQVRDTHHALAERVSAGATLEEIRAFTAQLAQLRADIDAAKG